MRGKIALLTALTLAILMIGGATCLAQGDGQTTYRAMLLGIDDYQNAPIDGCRTDMNRMMSLLQTADEAGGRYLTPVTRTNLTASELRERITEMMGWGVDNDDVSLLYFAGLGQITGESDANLIARDGKSIRLKDLRTSLDQLPGTKIIVLDCRYPDDMTNSGSRTPAQLTSLFNRAVVNAFTGGMTERDYQVISAMTVASSVTKAQGTLGLPAGPFTYYLSQACGYDYVNQSTIDLMADVNQNGSVSLSEARDYIQSRISDLSQEAGTQIVNDIAISPQDSTFPLFSKRATAETLSVTLSQQMISLAAGTNERLTATVLPVNTQQKTVSWISSDLSICSVDKDGLVSAHRPGTATVTCITANGMMSECTVLVRDVVFAESVSLSPTKLVIGSGQSQKLVLTLKPSDSNELVTWRTNDSSVASVDQQGTVSLLRNGSAIITATMESGKEVSCVVQAVDPKNVVEDITVDSTDVTLYEGQARLMLAKVKPSTATDPIINWSTSNEEIAQVEPSGMIVGVATGECVVTCTASSGVTTEIKVKVKSTTIELKQKAISLKPGKNGKIGYTIQPPGSNASISWTSSDEGIATVNQDGEVAAVANGQTIITAELPSGQKATCLLSVATVPVKGIKINKQKLGLTIGGTFQLKYKIAPGNASVPDVTWLSSNEEVATVSEDGMVTAVGVGKCTIAARTHNGKNAKCELAVRAPKITSIVLNSAAETFRLGTDLGFQLEAAIEPETDAGNRALKWQSSNKKVATVNGSGLVKFVGEGTATIRASSGKVKADCKITVVSNRTFHKKAQFGKERKVYSSLRQIAYQEGDLIIQMYFANRTKAAVSVPTNGTFRVTLQTGTSFELTDVPEQTKRKLGAGKVAHFTYTFSLAEHPELSDLELSGAKVELVAGSGEGT